MATNCSYCNGVIYDFWYTISCKQCYEKTHKITGELRQEIEDLKAKITGELRPEIEDLKAKITGELRPEIEDLKAKVDFLRFLSPINHPFPSISDSGLGYTDIVLIASSDNDKDPIPAHKVVLVSRSSVLEAMLEHETGKRRSGTINFHDVSYKALCAFVHYLYTAQADLDEQMAPELLEMAEKYEVDHLKAVCETFLISKLNWDNSIITYVFAHQQNATRLSSAALSLITANISKIVQRKEYDELLENHPRLLLKIYEAYIFKPAR